MKRKMNQETAIIKYLVSKSMLNVIIEKKHMFPMMNFVESVKMETTCLSLHS